jgi:large subunit ribosomal protein L32
MFWYSGGMSVRMHISHAKTGSRRGHIRLESPRVQKDAKTGAVHIRHTMQADGTYRGKKILDLTRQADKAAKRRAAKAEKKRKD